jgi:hypothetical protein
MLVSSSVNPLYHRLMKERLPYHPSLLKVITLSSIEVLCRYARPFSPLCHYSTKDGPQHIVSSLEVTKNKTSSNAYYPPYYANAYWFSATHFLTGCQDTIIKPICAAVPSDRSARIYSACLHVISIQHHIPIKFQFWLQFDAHELLGSRFERPWYVRIASNQGCQSQIQQKCVLCFSDSLA